MNALSSDLFVPVSRIAVVGSVAFGAIQVLRGRETAEWLVIGAAVGLLGIVFSQAYFSTLSLLSETLTIFIKSAGSGDSVFQVFSRLLDNAVKDAPMPAFNDPYGSMSAVQGNILGAALKTGVWGVITLIIEFLFMILGEVLQALANTLLQIIQIIFPIGAALYAARPEIIKNLALYSAELSLWLPCLSLIRGVVGLVSKRYLEGGETAGNPDLGLKMVAVQLAAIILFSSVPKFVHSILSGSLSGDMGVSPSGVFKTVLMPALMKAKGLAGAGGKAAVILLAFGLGWSANASERNIVKLYPGYVTKILCKGRLLVSALGDDQIVQKSALPSEVGCGLLLKPLAFSKRTNLILETSTGTVKRTIEIAKPGVEQPSVQAEILVEAGEL